MAQSKDTVTKPAPTRAGTATTVTGCVTPNAHAPAMLVIKTGDQCFLVSGTYDSAGLTGHTVILMGIAEAATGTTPQTLVVKKTIQTGEACTETCELVPPGTRGVHGNEKYGHKAGTSGAKDTSTPTPP